VFVKDGTSYLERFFVLISVYTQTSVYVPSTLNVRYVNALLFVFTLFASETRLIRLPLWTYTHGPVPTPLSLSYLYQLSYHPI